MTAAVKEAVIQFTEAKIELYEIIEVLILFFDRDVQLLESSKT